MLPLPTEALNRTKMAVRKRTRSVTQTGKADFSYSAEKSVGHQVRWTHRALQRALEARIKPHGITLGMWYFLRVLWERDGLTQRELSDCAGTTEPTTLLALRSMERGGLITRVPGRDDRRKSYIYLTASARRLKNKLLPEAKLVNTIATDGFTEAEISLLIDLLARMRKNLTSPVKPR